ncbi:hypothetical protein, partial [Salmonella enterica]|uniref:hypothetical protein n=1 Tax=Salmonella enterica TaxID=28901 RepID=UPI0019D58DF5
MSLIILSLSALLMWWLYKNGYFTPLLKKLQQYKFFTETPGKPAKVKPARVKPPQEPCKVELSKLQPPQEPCEVKVEVEPCEVEPREVEPREVEPLEVEPREVEVRGARSLKQRLRELCTKSLVRCVIICLVL